MDFAPSVPHFTDKDAGNPYRDFRTVEDLEETYRRVDQIKAIDRLLMDLSIRRGESVRLPAWAETFHPMLFNRWARAILGIEMSPAPLTRKQAEHFFRLVRRNDKGPPYRMAGFKEFFIDDLTRESFDVAAETVKVLREALSLIWDAFCQEYEGVAAGDLWGRYLRYLRIASGREVS